MEKLETAILKTLSYADIFDFPFKSDEIYRFLITDKKISRKFFEKALKKLKEEVVGAKKGRYFLKGREEIVDLREDKKRWSRKKLKIAKRVAHFLKIIPFVKMVAVTGALAMENSKKEDDIDFLIVTQKGRLWTTRFLVTILVEVLARRRRPGDKKITDKICLNMFLDEEHLGLPKKDQDLFTAHEVAQLKSLWDRDNTYQKFLAANRWVKRYLPNALPKIKNQISKIRFSFLILICHFSFCILNFAFIEKALEHLQLFYMKKRRTTEIISDGIIRFHPKDAKVWVLKEHQKRVNLLLE